MKKKIVSVNDLSDLQIKEIMTKVSKRTDIPLIKSEQINMRLSPDILFMAKTLAKKAGRPVTTFLAELLAEDLKRMWKIIG